MFQEKTNLLKLAKTFCKSPLLARSTEIPLSLVTEALYWSRLPGPVSVLGALLVAASVAAMAAHDTIISRVSGRTRGERKRRCSGVRSGE